MQAPSQLKFRTTLTFSDVDSPIIPGLPIASTSPVDTDLKYAHLALSQLVDQEGDSKSKAELGLCDSGRITLDIINGAQVRSECDDVLS